MANVKKKSSTAKAKKSAKKIEKEKDLVLDEDLDEEILEDDDFNLDDEDDDELALLETELEEVSSDERLIRVEKLTKANTVMLVICIILMIITMGLCININKGDSKDTTKKTSDTTETDDNNGSSGDNSYSTASFKTIKMKDIAKESKNKEIVVFLGRQGCYWCGLYAPIIGMAAEENKFDVYYLDFGSMVDFSLARPAVSDEEEYDALTTFIDNSSYASQIADGIGTPLTMFVKNNKIVNFIGGYVDASTLDTYLKKEGFIK